MKKIYVRPLRLYDETDKAAFVAAADASGKEFPKDVFTLLSTRIMVAEAEGKVIMFQPHFASLNLGSLIPMAGISPFEFASSQHMLTAAAYTRAHSEGFADILALSNDLNTQEFAKRHGFIACDGVLRLEVR